MAKMQTKRVLLCKRSINRVHKNESIITIKPNENVLNDIKRILWHEIGHFCVELLKSELPVDSKVITFNISYKPGPGDFYKWSGFIQTSPNPDVEKILRNDKVLSYELLARLSGCVFETIYLNNFTDENVVFEDCYGSQETCLGAKDKYDYIFLTAELNRFYKSTREVNFLTFLHTDLAKIYLSKVMGEKSFIRKLKTIVESNSQIVYKMYEGVNPAEEFIFELHSDSLRFKILKHQVLRVAKKHNFQKLIIGLTKTVALKISYAKTN